MGMFDTGDIVFPPKVGENKTIVVKGIERIENGKIEENFKKKGGLDCGFHYLVTLSDGKKMRMNTWKLYFAFKEAGIDIGDTVNISHPKTGEYIVGKIISPDKVFEE
jgi:hypothetical protein